MNADYTQEEIEKFARMNGHERADYERRRFGDFMQDFLQEELAQLPRAYRIYGGQLLKSSMGGVFAHMIRRITELEKKVGIQSE